MNRPKFRAWNVRRFLKEDEVAILQNGKILFLVKDGESDAEYREMDFLDVRITFYTGLQDKNGKEIYEGDIMRGYNAFGEAFEQFTVIEWNEKEARWTGADWSDLKGEEVIGNVWEDGELLNDRKTAETN